MARKFKILVKRADGKFQKYIVTGKTLKERYSRSKLTKTDRKQFKQLKGKRIFFERKPPEYVKWVGLRMGVRSRDRSLVTWFGFTKEVEDDKAFEVAIKNIESLDKREVTNRRIQQAMNEKIGWLEASDGFVYDTFIQTDEPDRSNFFVYDAKTGKKLIYDTRFRAWNFRTR